MCVIKLKIFYRIIIMSSEEKDYTETESETDSYVESTSSDEVDNEDDNIDLSYDVIKNYNVICELGRGAYSIVWLVYNINNNNFYALKVQNPTEYKDGVQEINFVKKLPTNPPLFNNLVEHIIEIRNKEKYLCSVWNLHCFNLDGYVRKNKFENGLPFEYARNIMKQLVDAVKILHKKFKVYHGDIKTDNILIKGINNRDKTIIQKYLEENFSKKYTEAKKTFWVSKGKNINKIDDMKKEDKLRIRKQLHREITEKVIKYCEISNVSKYEADEIYLNPVKTSLADFGTFCEEDNYYEGQFGTRYYLAPEIILLGHCSYPVDIWALGCTFYELLTGTNLFDPIKDANHSRDYYHLCLINQTSGNFPSTFLSKCKETKRFFDKRGRIDDFDNKDLDRLDRKLKEINIDSHTKDKLKELLKRMFEIDPKKRITIDELSIHKFFC